MELTSKLGEYGSIGAGGADCATESETKARPMNRLEAISFFIIVWDLILYFDLNYSEMSPELHYPNYQDNTFPNFLCAPWRPLRWILLCSFVSFVVKKPSWRLRGEIKFSGFLIRNHPRKSAVKVCLFRSPDHPITCDHPIFLRVLCG